MKFRAAHKLVERSLKTNHLAYWNFEYTEAVTLLGQCDYNKKLIQLSKYYVYLNEEDLIKDVVLHEIAHALTPDDKEHSEGWKETFIKLGGSGRRTYPTATHPPEKFLGFCNKEHYFETSRRPKKCIKCKKQKKNVGVVWDSNPEWLYFKRVCDNGFSKYRAKYPKSASNSGSYTSYDAKSWLFSTYSDF